MIDNILLYFFLFIFTLFPILIWWYVFSYVDDNVVNRKRFLLWVFAWALSVFPILYLDDFINKFNLKYLNIFYYISNISDFFSVWSLAFSLSFFIIFILIISFLFWGFIHKFKNIFSIYFKHILVFLIFIVFLSLIVYFLWFIFDKFSLSVNSNEYFWDIVFNSFKLVFFYYLLVSFIEETSKHFNFMQSSVFDIKDVRTGVLYSIFVALGFSLIENILYFYSVYSSSWFSYDFLRIYFFRSVFSVIVHITCSSIIAYYFSKAYLEYKNNNLSIWYIKTFLFWLFISILLHLVFNLSLNFWYSLVMFLYFIWGYLYVSSIFYRD